MAGIPARTTQTKETILRGIPRELGWMVVLIPVALAVASPSLGTAAEREGARLVDQAVFDDLAPTGELRVAFNRNNVAHAEVVPIEPGLRNGVRLLASGEIDALASMLPELLELAGEFPDSRVLDEGFSAMNPQRLAIPRGRPAGLAYLEQFVEEAKATGLVQESIDRHGLRGVRVAP